MQKRVGVVYYVDSINYICYSYSADC